MKSEKPCVYKQYRLCIALCKQHGSVPERASITSKVIHWATGAGEMDESDSPSTSNFDVIIAADCLFFKDFHEDLLTILSSRLTDEGILPLAS